MANGAYIGVGSKARKVTEIYIGVGSKARRVKKAYIGVGGKARLFWSAESPEPPPAPTITSWQKWSCNTTYTPEVGTQTVELTGITSVQVNTGTLNYNGNTGEWGFSSSTISTPQQANLDGRYWCRTGQKSTLYYSYTGNVSTISITTYPVTPAASYSKGSSFLGEVTSENENAYPNNGRHTDGYWYVKVS